MSSTPEASSGSDLERASVSSDEAEEEGVEPDVDTQESVSGTSQPGSARSSGPDSVTGQSQATVMPGTSGETHQMAVAKPKKHDRYGWNQIDRQMTKKETKLLSTYEGKEEKRAKKWWKMFDHFAKFRVYHRSTYEQRVRKGIPDTWRSRAWVWILDKMAEKEERDNKRTRRDVMFYFNKGVPDADDVIRNDIPITKCSSQKIQKNGFTRSCGPTQTQVHSLAMYKEWHSLLQCSLRMYQTITKCFGRSCI